MSHSLTTRGAEIVPLVDSTPTQISHWLTGCFLPHWVRRALADGRPGYAETVRQDGTPMHGRERSTLVTARLVYTFSLGHVLDADIGCLSAADHGLDFLLHACRTTNGRFVHSVEEDGHVLDQEADLYDLAFVLLALAGYAGASASHEALLVADEVASFLDAHLADPHGGYRETVGGSSLRRQFPHMHLLEACQLLSRLAPERGWQQRSEALVDLADTRFVAADGGVGEWYGNDWRPAAGARGNEREIGHQFEWAWLLYRQANKTGSARAVDLADRLYSFGTAAGGVTRGDPIAPMLNAIDHDGKPRCRLRPLWPMAELLRASIAAEALRGEEPMTGVAEAAMEAIFTYYLDARTGLWINEIGHEDNVASRTIPLRVLYHLVPAFAAYCQVRERAFSVDPILRSPR